jgi:hypothetical protein
MHVHPRGYARRLPTARTVERTVARRKNAYFVLVGPPPRVSGMPTPGGGGGGGGGGVEAGRGAVLGCGASVLTVPSAYRECERQQRDLDEEREAGELEHPRETPYGRVIVAAEALDPVRQPAMHLLLVVSDRVKRLAPSRVWLGKRLARQAARAAVLSTAGWPVEWAFAVRSGCPFGPGASGSVAPRAFSVSAPVAATNDALLPSCACATASARLARLRAAFSSRSSDNPHASQAKTRSDSDSLAYLCGARVSSVVVGRGSVGSGRSVRAGAHAYLGPRACRAAGPAT